MSSLEFFAAGKPETKGSTKSFRHPATGRIVTLNDNPKTKAWAKLVGAKASASGVALVLRPSHVSLEVEFVLPRPKSHSGTGRNSGTLKATAPPRHVYKPDVDKLLRAILDALTGIAYEDDSQVDTVSARKVYADPGDPAGARVWVSS